MADLQKTAEQLSDIERKTLLAMADKQRSNESRLAETAKLPLDSVRRATEWLSGKGLVEKKEDLSEELVLTAKGNEVRNLDLPEIRLLEFVEKNSPVSLKESQQKTGLLPDEFNVAFGWNKKNGFLSIISGQLNFTGLSKEKEYSQRLEEREKGLDKIHSHGKVSEELKTEFLQRGLIEKKILTGRTVALTENGSQAIELLSKIKTRSYDISSPAPNMFVGKKQPYVQFLNQIRRRLTELGFVEMESPLITQEFYHFDVLFQPQNHPARQWTDTYQLKQPKTGKLPERSIVLAIKNAHETGGIAASSGWQYSWNEEIAKRVLPSGHSTSHSGRQLVKGIQIPGKYFSIARCYRPDVIDATHLIEFNQMEGFITGENLNFKHLLGMLKQFATEFAGAKQVKFEPSYYPFTEPSVQLNAKHSILGWVELGGAGIFRPEMTENLGIKAPCLAWGFGIDRLAMLKLGINDIRYLFSDDLNWLRKQPLVMPDALH
ncbi:MAG: phenylalanine--tRNA ligase subunit alpha [Candidatus Micrarchaeota archaeon]